MCPYARFQSVMFDPDTLTITYDETRGEPRGTQEGRGSKNPRQGDCVDCGICVQVCPTGIDIRNGLQYECIGCAACIDACDQVMDKMNYPRGLIRYSTENAIKKGVEPEGNHCPVFRPRTLIYGAILALLSIAFVVGIATRSPLRVDIIRDRSMLAREVEGGLIENIYRLQVMNMSESARKFELSASGLENLRLSGNSEISVEPATIQSVNVQVQVPADAAKPGSHQIFSTSARRTIRSVHVREKQLS